MTRPSVAHLKVGTQHALYVQCQNDSVPETFELHALPRINFSGWMCGTVGLWLTKDVKQWLGGLTDDTDSWRISNRKCACHSLSARNAMLSLERRDHDAKTLQYAEVVVRCSALTGAQKNRSTETYRTSTVPVNQYVLYPCSSSALQCNAATGAAREVHGQAECV